MPHNQVRLAGGRLKVAPHCLNIAIGGGDAARARVVAEFEVSYANVDGAPQQIHLDLHVDDPASAIAQATRLGARPLRTDSDLADDNGHYVFADPAGHPFCIGWGHPDEDALRQFLGTLPPQAPT